MAPAIEALYGEPREAAAGEMAHLRCSDDRLTAVLLNTRGEVSIVTNMDTPEMRMHTFTREQTWELWKFWLPVMLGDMAVRMQIQADELRAKAAPLLDKPDKPTEA